MRGEKFSADYHDSSLINFKPSENLVGGRVTLTYNTAANTLIYSTISKGYKAGGFNTDGTLDRDLRNFDSEGLLNYEIGFKGMLFEKNLLERALEGGGSNGPVDDMVSANYTTVDGNTEISVLAELFRRFKVAVVLDDKSKPVDIITRIDLIDYMSQLAGGK